MVRRGSNRKRGFVEPGQETSGTFTLQNIEQHENILYLILVK